MTAPQNSKIEMRTNCHKLYSCCWFSGDLLTPSSISVAFTPSAPNTLCATVPVNDDEILERNEMFSFSLLSTDPAITEIVPDGGEITILDNNDREFQQ